jgi:uncharacterized protein (DUF849 family)
VEKLIITAALTGAATVPSQSKYIPVTPEQLADDAEKCVQAGAAVIHVHARNPENGMPTGNMEVFGEILKKIKERTDAVICTTTGGGFNMTPDERVRVVPTWQPELATCNMGSINFALYPVMRHFKPEDYQYEWEEAYLANSEDYIFPNTFKGIRTYLKYMDEANTRPEFELYDVGHIYNMAHMIERGLIKTPVWCQFVMGVLGGIRATIPDLVHMVETADRVIGRENYNWSVIGVGYPHEFELATVGMFMGGHVRVGLEDNLMVRRKTFGRNHELVERMAGIAHEYERELATPADVREFLSLKGLDKVGF